MAGVVSSAISHDDLDTLGALPSLAWEALAEGVSKGRDPFHTVTLATTGPAGAEARTVVLRGADAEARTLACHTDLRSGKVEELRADPRCTWLCYDRGRKLQLRRRLQLYPAGRCRRRPLPPNILRTNLFRLESGESAALWP